MSQLPPSPSTPPPPSSRASRTSRARPRYEGVLVAFLGLMFFIPGIAIYRFWKRGLLGTKTAVIITVVSIAVVYTLVLGVLFTERVSTASGQSKAADQLDGYIARVLPALRNVSTTGNRIDTALSAAAKDTSGSTKAETTIVRVCGEATIAYRRDLQRLHIDPPASVAAIHSQFLASVSHAITVCDELHTALPRPDAKAAGKAVHLWLTARDEFLRADAALNQKAKSLNNG